MPKQSVKKSTEPKRVYLGRPAWEQHVAAYLTSGMTVSEYGRQHRLVLPTFQAWVTKVKREKAKQPSSAINIVPVRMTTEALFQENDESVQPSVFEITLLNGI